MSASKQANVQKKKVIFNASAVAAHLGGLKKAWDAANEGKDATPESHWWRGALRLLWYPLRKAGQGTQWGNVEYINADGLAGRLVVRIMGERHIGRIQPNTDEGVAEVAARVKNPKVRVEKRTKKACIQIQKWDAIVKTADDEITVLADAQGKPILPDDDKLSPYYALASLVGEAFMTEARWRLDRGAALIGEATAMRKADKAAGVDAILAAFAAANGPSRPGDAILSAEGVAALRKVFPNPKELEVFTKGTLLANNTKVVNPVQEFVSNESKQNAGCPLPNPLTRISMEFVKETGVADFSLHDKTKPFTVEGKPRYEAASVDTAGADGKVVAVPVNANNVHKFVLSGSRVDGIVNFDSICFSNMGISIPVKADVLIVEPRSSRDADIDDVYGDDDPPVLSAASQATVASEVKSQGPPAANQAAPGAAKAAAGAKPLAAQPAKAGAAKGAAPTKATAKAATSAAPEPALNPDEMDNLLDGLGGEGADENV